jgi:hypothetical protein
MTYNRTDNNAQMFISYRAKAGVDFVELPMYKKSNCATIKFGIRFVIFSKEWFNYLVPNMMVAKEMTWKMIF